MNMTFKNTPFINKMSKTANRILKCTITAALSIVIITSAPSGIYASQKATTATAQTTSATTASTQASAQKASAASSQPASQAAKTPQSTSASKWPAAPSISAGSAVLIDADTGAILYDKDCHSKAYPASTTKIMTALLAIENNSLDDVITFSRAAANSYKWDEANTGTREGEQFTLEQALYATLLKSANEVAYGIAEHVAGSIPAFSEMMNKRAKELGALNTHFNNPNGLSDPEHYTTAYDLAMIGRACFNNSTFMTIDSAESYQIGPTNKTAQTRYFTQRHGMVKGNGYQYEYCKGGKTGFTDESGYTLITFAQKDNMRLICVVFREADDASRYIDTKALFDYGFNNFHKTAVSSSDVSSLFNSSSYYNSKVYGNSNITFSMDSSYVDLPSDVSLSDVEIKVESNDTSDDAYDFTADIIFTYDSHTVGSAKLLVNTLQSDGPSSNLPYISKDNSSVVSQKKCLVINIWYVIIGIVLILAAFEIYESIRENRMRRRRRQRARRRHR
ncbi:MAG: D-alanyl-D-alanine carboxypeptidase family protein [Bacteroides sp.]